MMIHASHLTDPELIGALAPLAGAERGATVDLIVHLGEFDLRRLHEPEGFPSTFAYCVEVLKLSEDAAFNRIAAARATRQFPGVLEMLRTGALSPTTARTIARHLTPETADRLLTAAAGKSKREVEKPCATSSAMPSRTGTWARSSIGR